MNVIKSLTGLRGYAAFMVFVSHMYHFNSFGIGGTLKVLMDGLGHVGVSIFFVLSGFVLFVNYPPGRCSAREFYVARLARIYPAYLFCVLLSVPLELFSPNKSDHAIAFVASVSLCQQWHPLTDGRFNDVGWTLSVEAFFYILFPLLLLVIRNSLRRALWLVAATLVLSIAFIVLANPGFYSTRHFPPNRLFEFALGMAAGLVFTHHGGSSDKAGRIACLCIAGAAGLLASPVITHASPTLWRFADLIYGGFAVCVVWSLARLERQGFSSCWLTSQTAVLAGEISYSFYLLHNLVLRYFSRGMSIGLRQDIANWPIVGQLTAATILFALTAFGSWMLFRFLEMPLRGWIRRRLSRK